MTLFLRFVMYWWPSFLVISSCAWILLSGRTTSTENTVNTVNMPQIRPRGRMTVWIGSLCLVVGMAIGYISRGFQLDSNKFTYTDVTVLSKYNNKEFVIWPDRMKQLHVQLCETSVVGWRKGEILDDFTFEQQEGCKRVISYHEKPKGEVNASIQIR